VVASGNEVGKISIRVVPNLEDFHDDIKRQLAEEEKKRHKIKIGVDVDTSSIPREIKAAEKSVDDLEVGVDTDTSSISSDIQSAASDVDATVEVDAELNRRALLEQTRSLLDGLKPNIDLTPDEKKFKREVEAQIAELTRQVRSIPIGVELDQVRAAAFLAEIEAIKALYEGTNIVLDARVEVDEDRLQNNLRSVVERLRRSRILFGVNAPLRVPVEVDVDVDKNRISRSLSAITSGISSGLKGLGKAVDAAGNGLQALSTGATSAVKAVARLPEWLLLTVAVAAILAPALALVAGSLVALPGLMTAFAVPIAAVALGVDGIKKAAEAAKPAFDKLKETMSKTFQDGMTPGFQTLADKLFPRLQSELPKVAESLSGLFDVFTNTLTTDGNLGKIEGTIRGIATALSQAAPGVASFTNAFTTLINSTAGPMLSSLSGTINKLGGEFEAWVGKVTANGQLQVAMDTLKGTLGEIGGIFKDIASFSFDALADPKFGAAMKGFVEDARELTNMILPLLKSGFEDVASAVSGITTAFGAVRDSAKWVSDLVKKFDDLTGAEPKVPGQDQKDLWGNWSEFGINDDANIVKWLGLQRGKAGEAAAAAGTDAGKKFQESLTQAAANASAGGASLTDAINKQLASGVDVNNDLQKQALQSAFSGTGVTDAVAGQIETQMGAVISRAQAAVKELGPTLQADIDAALLPLQDIPAKMMPAFEGIGAAIGGAWGGITAFIRTATGEMGNIIAQEFMNIPAKLMPAIAGFGAAVGGAVGAIKGFIANAGFADAFGQAFAGVPGRVSAALAGVTGAIASALTPALGVVASTVAGILASLQGGLAAVVPVVEGSFAAVPAVVAAKMAEANAAVAAGGQQMVSTALAFAGAMESAGRSIGASFAAGIASSAGLVSAAAQSLVAAARVFFPNSPAKEGPFSGSGWVDKSGEAVGEGFASGMSASQQEVVATARALMQSVKDIFGDASGLTLNFNLGGVTQQAEAATKQVQVFGDTLSKVPTGPLNDLAVASGAGGLSAADSKAQRDELSQQLDLLEMERKSLELEKGRAGANQDAIKARLAEIKEQKLQLGLQKDQLDYAKKYGAETEQTGGKVDQFYRDMGEKIFKMPTDFARAIGSQFTQDLGISGQGAIPQLLEQGSQFIFQVANMDTALSAQQTLQRRQGMGLVGR
jgi:hypothetical protein